MAVDAAGDVFVADGLNNAVKEIPAGGGAIRTLGSGFSPRWAWQWMRPETCSSSNEPGANKSSSMRSRPTAAPSRRSAPASINRCHGGGRGRQRVRRRRGQQRGQGDPGRRRPHENLGSGFSSPSEVAVDAAGDVFVADNGNNRVVELSPPSVAATPSPLGGSTATAVSAALTGLTPGTTYYYRAVAASAGRHRRRRAAAAAIVHHAHAADRCDGTADPISTTGAALNASVNPQGLTATVSFQYSTDPAFTPTVQTILGSGFNYPIGRGGGRGGRRIHCRHQQQRHQGNPGRRRRHPDARLRLQSAGRRGGGRGGRRVRRRFRSLAPSRRSRPAAAPSRRSAPASAPSGVAVDAAGDVFVADTGNNAVKEIPAGGGPIQTLGSGFSCPTGVAVDAAGNVFVADLDNNAVKEIPAGGGAIQTLGSGFDQPTSVAVDAAGNVFVADAAITRSRRSRPAAAPSRPSAPASASPSGVAVDAAGDVFVADSGNNRVVELSPPSVAATPSSLGGSTTTDVSAALTGLTPATTYYYRAVASSAAGIVADAQQPPQSFTTPSITWTDPADMQYGTPLGSSQLDATASIPGSFSYTLADDTTAADGAVLNAGQNQVLNVTFTPTDSTHYATETAQATINVNPATLTVTADDKSRAFGQPNPTLTDTITGFVNGDNASVVSGAASLSTTATTSSPVGSYPITAALGTLNSANYTFAFQNGTLTVTTNSQGAFGLAEDVYVIGSGTVSVSAANGVLANDTRRDSSRSPPAP